jgi:hypothetical protein
MGTVDAPWWSDKPVVLIGGGASLKGFDFARLDALDAHIVAVNHAMFHVKCCAGVTIDRRFLREREDRIRAFLARSTPLYLARPPGSWEAKLPGCIHLANRTGGGLSADLHLLHGSTSGHAALNLAALKRARRIILLGYDYSLVDGADHYHDDYPWHRLADLQSWPSWARHYDKTRVALDALGVEVINASPHSAITAFARTSIEQALSLI